MVRSIRWRLVMGTMLLTLLTVCAVGVVALLLMQRYMVQQERAYLTANAEAIARQAATLMTPFGAAPPLQQLAQTAAFLGDSSVRIVDNAQTPLADSAQSVPVSMTASAGAPAVYFRIAPPITHTNAVWTLAAQEFTLATSDTLAPAGVISPTAPQTIQAANVIVVQKSPSFWGDRLTFAAEAVPAVASAPFTDALPTTAGVPAAYGGEIVYNRGALMPATMFPPQERGAMDDAVAQGAVSAIAQPVTADGVADRFAVWAQPVNPGVGASPSLWQLIGFQATDVVTAPIQLDGMTIGVVELGRATDLVDEPLAAIRRALAIAAGASSLLALAVGLVMSRTLTAPIQNLAQAAAAMSSGDLTARAPVVGRDELGALARQFNQMADALHRSFADLAAERDTLRRFVADASHELRTPITALRTFNELLQGPAQDDHSAQAEFLAESQAQIARLEWITRNLLDLSRWDGGMATLTLAEVEVGELVATTATPFRALAQEREIELAVVVPTGAVLATADEQRLAMAVANLLDNALKFTPRGGRVEVGVAQEAGQVKVWVADTGSGIDVDDLPHIFERFYRSPRATQSGSGLGLAIVERIVAAHGATIQVASRVGEGSHFELGLVARA